MEGKFHSMVAMADIIMMIFPHVHVLMTGYTSLGQNPYIMQNYLIREMTWQGS